MKPLILTILALIAWFFAIGSAMAATDKRMNNRECVKYLVATVLYGAISFAMAVFAGMSI